MAIENSVSNDFLSTFVDSTNVFDCRLPGVVFEYHGWLFFKNPNGSLMVN